MTVTFFINYLNHHQLPVADEMYRLLGSNFHFVATYPRNPTELKGGVDYSDRPYCLLAAEMEEDCKKAHRLNIESDVCVYGAGNLDWERERATTNKLAFEISERWFKRGVINLFSPRLWKWWFTYQLKLRNRPFYKLCASAYTSSDCRKLFAYKGKCFKWGYFTKVDNVDREYRLNGAPRIMWCARFVSWKHPELPVKLAHMLRDNGYDFRLEMYGEGELKHVIQKKIEVLNLNDYVELKGNVPNSEIRRAMLDSDIFLFTSDRNEGWGAVMNESMASGCCPVADIHIGSAPYLIDSWNNGLVYSGINLASIYEKVKYLLDNPSERVKMGCRAAVDLKNIWSPANAAKNFVTLVEELLSDERCKTSIIKGPCSPA